MKRLKRRLKYKLERLRYWKALFSPFKPFRIRFYAGKLAIGTPYFFPRKWVKATPELARKATLDYIKSEERYNELNPKSARKIKPYEEIYQEKLRYNYAKPIKVGFDSCGLGWKTKWTDTDFRYEWGPVFTFVFFGYQLAWTISAPQRNHYWEAWLYYEYATDKSKSKRERIAECRKQFSQTWISYSPDGSEEKVDYYERILKPKYLK
jgi:hypothetical protein